MPDGKVTRRTKYEVEKAKREDRQSIGHPKAGEEIKEQKIARLLFECWGIPSEVARRLKVSPPAITYRIKSSPFLQECKKQFHRRSASQNGPVQL